LDHIDCTFGSERAPQPHGAVNRLRKFLRPRGYGRGHLVPRSCRRNAGHHCARHWTSDGFTDASNVVSMMSVGFTAIGIRLMLRAHSLRSEMLVAISCVSAEL